MALAPTCTVPACANTGKHTYSRSHFFLSQSKFIFPRNNISQTKIITRAVTEEASEISDKTTKANTQVTRRTYSSKPRKQNNPKRYNETINPLLQSLNDCEENNKTLVYEILDSLDYPPTPKEATIALNNIRDWKKGYWVFEWLQNNKEFEMNKIVYNVTMKVLRRGKQWDLVEKLLNDMLARGIEPDNVTYSTVISSARQCGLPHKAVEWFERMVKESKCVPDEVTYTTMMDAYSRAGKVEEALDMYEGARGNGWRPDAVTYSTLLHMYSLSGNLNGALVMFEEMKALGVKPNVVIYNNMFSVLLNAMKPTLAKDLYKEMVDCGLQPNEVTVTFLLRIFGKARWADDAFQLWDKIKQENWRRDNILYNTMLSMCGDTGNLDMAAEVFEDLLGSDIVKPNSWSYTCMIDVYSKHGMIDEANGMLMRMKDAGFEPSLVDYTLLVFCYGRAKRFDDVVSVCDLIFKKGFVPDVKFCGCLLAVLTYCDKEEDFSKALKCLKKADAGLASIVSMLKSEKIDYGSLEEKLGVVLAGVPKDSGRIFCNFLIDMSHAFEYQDRAHKLLSLGMQFGVYPDLYMKSPKEWCLQAVGLSFHAALTAFQRWIKSVSKALEDSSGEDLPPFFVIYTGRGRHHLLPEQSLSASLGSVLEKHCGPFQETGTKSGRFFATKEALQSWLRSNSSLLIAI